MKILQVIANLGRERGGPAQVVVELAKLMARKGHQVRIVTTDSGLPPEYRVGAPQHRDLEVSIEPYPLNRPHFWATSWAMRRRLEQAIPEADVVHVHSLYLFHDWVVGSYCHCFNVPYIVRPHGTLDPYIRRRHRFQKTILGWAFQNRMLRDAAGLQYTTQEEMELAQPAALNSRGWVVPNGIDLSAFDALPPRMTLRKRFPQIENRKVVLFFGRLNFKKGLHTTIAAFAEVAAERPDIYLLIAGPDGGLRADAERWVDAAGIRDRTLFTGMVTGEDKRVVLGGSDVFLLPSLSENFGISVVEAAACGIPVVISDRVNLWHDFAENNAGLVAPPDAAHFAHRLRQLLNNSTEAAEMAARGSEMVRRKFAWETLATQYEEMYREASAAPF